MVSSYAHGAAVTEIRRVSSMSDVELIVKIPEGAYQLLKNEGVDWLGAEHILNAVAEGTPLPKGHRDLIEYKTPCGKEYDAPEQGCDNCEFTLICNYITAMPTIIVADSEG